MVSLSNERLLQIAVAHGFLSTDHADKLQADANQLNLPVEALAIKSGLLKAWQIEAARALSTPNDVAPGYAIKSVLGRGGFGSVYLATQNNMSRDVALKTIPLQVANSSSVRRFEREAKIVGRLRHPHIVAAYDFGFHRERMFLSLELVDGKDLTKVLRRVVKFDELTTWHILRQTVSALAYAAENGVTHRDIKPSNLLVTYPPIGYSLPSHVPFVKVSDFGLACFTETRRDDGITLENSGLGTPSYVAPEQLRGEDVDVRADIYSMGATAFHLLNGKPPYAFKSAIETAREKLAGNENWTSTFPDNVPAKSQAIIKKMSAYEVADRFKDHHELLAAIEEVIQDLEHTFDEKTEVFRLNMDLSSDTSIQEAESKSSRVELETKSSGDMRTDFAVIEDSALETTETSIAPEISRWSNLGVVSLLVIFAVVAFCWFVYSPTDEPNTLDLLEPNPIAIVRSFDGLKLDYSKFKLRRGTWSIEQDEEGGKVLAGTNCRVVFPCNHNDGAPIDFFKFSIGVGIKAEMSDTTISARFVEPKSEQLKFVLSAEGIRFATVGDADEKLLNRTFPWKIPPSQTNGYNRITIENQPVGWRIFQDSELIVELSNIGPQATEIEIEVEGQVFFESPEITPLVEYDSISAR